MCNPRRVEITATRQVEEAWAREVERVAEHALSVTGEARVRHALDASVAVPALDALERALEAGLDGWAAVEGGYRFDVDGGAVTYRPDDGVLEIVAYASDEVRGWGRARAQLTGEVSAALAHRGESLYYDDGYGGSTEEVARREAEAEAEHGIDALVAGEIERAAEAAEAAAAADLDDRARQAARADVERRAAARERELASEASERLRAVGVRARQAFHRALAIAYRDALLALARARGAEEIRCNDSGDVLEIEFTLPD